MQIHTIWTYERDTNVHSLLHTYTHTSSVSWSQILWTTWVTKRCVLWAGDTPTHTQIPASSSLSSASFTFRKEKRTTCGGVIYRTLKGKLITNATFFFSSNIIISHEFFWDCYPRCILPLSPFCPHMYLPLPQSSFGPRNSFTQQTDGFSAEEVKQRWKSEPKNPLL